MIPFAQGRRSQSSLAGVLAGLGLLTLAAGAQAKDYFVAPTGNDSNDGSMAMPFATLQKGADVAVAGDTVYLRGGTYNITTPDTAGAGVTFSKSGTSDTNRIKYWAYEKEVPVLDFTNMTLSTTGYTHGFVVTGSWLHFKGLELRNVKMNTRSNNAIAVSGGGHDIFELLNLHHLAGTGIFIGKGEGGHLVLNTDAHDNYDPTSSQGDGQNADGFGVHYQTAGATTILRGCRAWWNSDDGYDFINQEVPVIVENSWAMGNGYINSGADRPGDGNGNGFKAGSSKTGIRHVIRGSLAWKNAAAGFYANHSSGGNDWFNNTAYNNGTAYNMLASDPTDANIKIILMGDKVHKMRNNIGFPNKNTNMEGVDTALNTWDLAIAPAAADFVSVMDTGALGPRQADGSLPNVDFMKLPAGSKMIDKGVDVGLPKAGAAPDLGAFEYGVVVAVGGTSAGGTSAGGAPDVAGTSAGGAAIGGSPASGGSAVTPGAGSSSGGAGNSAGNAAVAGAATSGGTATASGGTTAGGGTDGPGDEPGDDAGCGCAVVGTPTPSRAAALIGVLAALGLVGRVRSRRARELT